MMILPGTISQRKSKPSSHPYSKQQKYQNLNKRNNSLNSSLSISPINAVSSSSSSSSLIDVPETFDSTSNIVSKTNPYKSIDNSSYQQHQHQSQNQMYQQLSGTNYHSENKGSSMNQYNQAPYSNMPNYSGHMSNQFSTGLYNNSQKDSNQFQHQSGII